MSWNSFIVSNNVGAVGWFMVPLSLFLIKHAPPVSPWHELWDNPYQHINVFDFKTCIETYPK